MTPTSTFTAALRLAQLTTDAPQQGWQYAAWVAVDLRLLLFLTFISALTAGGIATLMSRGRGKVEVLAIFALTFAITLGLTIMVFNQIAHYPVFAIERFFPFP